jgi:three-Cys-motif partner protein
MTQRRPPSLQFDHIGYWSEVKLDIVKRYSEQYSTIFNAERQARFYHVYIDAFAGAGIHLSKTSGEWVPGSPLNALLTDPPFREYHFIDLDGQKVEHLRDMVGDRPDVRIYPGDCNSILLGDVLPNVPYEQYRRGLCLLDPYGLHLDWQVIRKAGELRTIDLFLNFPIADMNRNVIWHNPDGVDGSDIRRMNRFWGDETCREVAYEEEQTMFWQESKKAANEVVAEAFRTRLKEKAGFARVPAPLPMRNTRGAVVYYLFFASHNRAAERIVTHIFNKYRDRE